MPQFDPSQPFEDVAVEDAPKFKPDQPFEPINDGEKWKPLFSGLDQAPADPGHAEALGFLGKKLGDDKELRAQAINQSYVQTKLPEWQSFPMQQNWPTIRDQYAKEAGFTQGEPITDSALYGHIKTSIDEEGQKSELVKEITAISPDKRAAYVLHNFGHLFSLNAAEWWRDQNKPFVEIPDAPQVPSIPSLGVGNPAISAGVWNSMIKPIVSGLETPMGVGTLGVGGLVSAGKAAGVPLAKEILGSISGLFAGWMAKSAIEKLPETVKVLKDPNATLQQQVEAVGAPVSEAAMSLLAGFHAVAEFAPESLSKVKGKTPDEAAQIMRQEANATPEPAARDALLEAAEKLDDIPSPPKLVEETKATETPKGEETPVKTEETGKVTAEEISKEFSIKNESVNKELKAMGEEPLTKGEVLSDKEAMATAVETLREDPEAGAKLVDELMSESRPTTTDETVLLQHEWMRLRLERQKLEEARVEASKVGDVDKMAEISEQITKAREDLVNTAEVLREAGAEQGRAFRARQLMLKEDYSLAAMERDFSEATGAKLSEEQAAKIAELSKRIEETGKAFEEYKARTHELLVKDEPPEVTPRRNKPPGKVASRLSEQARLARERIKARLTEGRVSSGLDPARLAAMLADHAIIGADYIARGFSKFSDWSREMLREFGEKVRPHLKEIFDRAREKRKEEARLEAKKTRLVTSTKELKRRVAEGDFSPKTKSKIELDEEGVRIEAEHERAKEEYQKMVLKEQLAKRGPLQKGLDVLTKWRRGFLLSSPVTLAKLTAAAAQRMVFNPIEEGIGGALGKLPGISKVAEQAPREGGLNLSAEARSITSAFTKGMEDAAKVLTTGKGNLDSVYGKKAGQVHMSDIMPRAVIDFFGNLHGALKAPVKRAEFTRSFEKRTAHALENGIDVTDPLVQTRIAVEAYKDANASIFMQDNMVTDAYKRALSRFEQINKETGKPSPGGLAAAGTLRVLLPIVKVPTNIVAETLQYAGGLGSGSLRLAHALIKGVDTLTPEQADLIMRELKKGSIGGAALLLGYMNPDVFGGYYQPGEKRKENDAKVGSIRTEGHDIPSFLLHSPLMETFQIGATVRRVGDAKLHHHDKESQGIANGAWAAALGLIEEVPFAREAVEMGKVFDPHERTYAEGELLKSILVPAVLQWTAAQMDRDSRGEKIKRKPKTIGEHIKTGIPGLREEVPKRK